MTVDDLFAPITAAQFDANYYGRRPLHIPASQESACARAVLDWAGLSALLQIAPHWTEPNLKLVLNSQAISPEFYLDEVATQAGRVRRATPAKIELFLAMGASLVANGVEDISPPIRRVGALLSDRFAGIMGANIYCSFKGVQAFASHFDLSEIFVLHCAGEKTWRLYQNRAPDPLFLPSDGQQEIDRAKGRVMAEIVMRPGDLLYLPRGWYHDALASSEAALHVTYAVTPHSGRILFRLLEEAALEDPAFRAYLPDGRTDGAGLGQRLADLAARLSVILQGPAFRASVATEQRKLITREHFVDLPQRPALHWYQATGTLGSVERARSGWMLQANGRSWTISEGLEGLQWALGRAAFSRQELEARVPHEADAAEAMIRLLLEARLFVPMAAPPSL